MRQICSIVLGAAILATFAGISRGASEEAMKLRGHNALSQFAPPEPFLLGNFVADEVDPAYIFGKVKDFVGSRSCPTTWLIENGEKKRLEARDQQTGPVEYTLFLEEDCPGKVTYFVFVDRSQADSAQWMEWRKQFHKSKAEPQYAGAKAGLEQAAQKGFRVEGELRFIEIRGELQLKKPEDVLTGELKFQPIFDLKEAKPLSR